MKSRTSLAWPALPMFVIGLKTSAWAADMDAMKRKAETVKGQAEKVTKEGGEVLLRPLRGPDLSRF